ncbi:MAG TPA: hypothetical protein VFZ41_08020 [Solirubrobacterales bacterium]
MIAYLALFVALGSGAYAVNQLPKNSVGAKQLKKNAVTKQKIRKNAVTRAKIRNRSITGAKVRPGSLTGAQIDASTLGTVPTAQSADTAGTANTANLANSLAPSEDWHVVGAPGEPGFLNSWVNTGGSALSAAFYKDRQGVVHLRGLVQEGTSNGIFLLPPGYRPAGGKIFNPPIGCVGGLFCSSGVGPGEIRGANWGANSGLVSGPLGATLVGLDGVSFRAES